MLSAEEKSRYARQLRLNEWSEEAQVRLKNAKVLVVGAGALGCPVLQYLSAAGVGTIGIVDNDRVDITNLHRQTLYREEEVGQFKAEVAKNVVQATNSRIHVEVIKEWVNADNIDRIASKYNVLVDATDNFPTRYLINDFCVLYDKVNIHGSIQQFAGQVSVFHGLDRQGQRTPNYRDLFPQPPNPENVVSCAEGGVIGALPGIIGSMMAMECLKVLTGVGEPMFGQLFMIDSLTQDTQKLYFKHREDNPLTGTSPTQYELIDYDQFCGIKKEKEMKEIDVQELKRMMDSKEDFALIDVREEHEFEQANMDGHLIPLGQIPERFNEIPKDKPVVVHCRMGGRSANAIMYLQQQGFDNLMNLKGGITAWANEIDPSLNV